MLKSGKVVGCFIWEQAGEELKKKVTCLQENASTVAWLLRQRPAGGSQGRKRRAIDRAVEVIGIGWAEVPGKFCGIYLWGLVQICIVARASFVSAGSRVTASRVSSAQEVPVDDEDNVGMGTMMDVGES